MKLRIVLVILLSSLASPGQTTSNSSDQIGKPFVWKGEAKVLMSQEPGADEVGDDFDAQPNKLSISREVTVGDQVLGPGTYTLRTLNSSVVSHLTTKDYAITGHLSFQDVQAGSYLELENWFAPDQPGGPEKFYFTRTLAEAGPMAKIEGSESRDFVLPFDATSATTPLERLVLKLHLTGHGYLEFSNVRLVEYPATVASKSAGSANSARSDGFDMLSFLLGILATVGTLMALGGLGALVHLSQRLRHARELRRMSSLDG